MKIPIEYKLQNLINTYDNFIIDIWGVIHGGGYIYEEAANCLSEIRSNGKNFIFLSNAPRRASNVSRILEKKGLPTSLCRDIMSSGEAARIAFSSRSHESIKSLGKNYLMLGTKSDQGLLDNLPYNQVSSLKNADFILGIGLNENTTSVSEHEDLFRESIHKGITMVCVNPDIEVIREGKKEPCAGALAHKYETLGGSVIYYGKPYEFIYTLCMNKLENTNKKRTLCIGDGVQTDILGANNFGFDALLITGGLIANQLNIDRSSPAPENSLKKICQQACVKPIAAMPYLSW